MIWFIFALLLRLPIPGDAVLQKDGTSMTWQAAPGAPTQSTDDAGTNIDPDG